MTLSTPYTTRLGAHSSPPDLPPFSSTCGRATTWSPSSAPPSCTWCWSRGCSP